MGITGLIPFLEKASSRVYLKDIRGCTVAVDTYCWLHKGVFSCAEKLVRGEETDLYVQYCLKYIQMLLSYDIKPILVFDGQHLPAKALTEERRRESRKNSKKRAAELLRMGHVEEARSQMRRCVDVTHEMALRLIRECHAINVDCIVAPYEADAQMAWFNKVDIAQYIITEDSDLTLFGARKVIFKLDLNGAGLLVDAEKLHLAMGCREEKYNFEKFRRMCILSGCDYLDSLPGIGLAKACKFVLKMDDEEDISKALKRMPSYIKMSKLEVNDEYIENFLKAEATFKHMYIYNPIERRMERLNAVSIYGTDLRYCSNAGTLLEDSDQSFNLALGNLNPFTLKQLHNWHPDKYFGLQQANAKNTKRAKHKSIWQENFKAHGGNMEPAKPKDNCALFFKKVDFISKTIDTEIEANIRTENAKPEESEVFFMYNAKRRKRSTSNSSSNSESGIPTSPIQQQKSHHNPFAKEKPNTITNVEQPPRSPFVCENASLLRILSPKKLTQVVERQEQRISKLKRSIFDTTKSTTGQVEIRSRFFESNIKQATKRKNSDSEVSKEVRKIVDEIESRVAAAEELQAKFYSPPTPLKTTNTRQCVEESSDVSTPKCAINNSATTTTTTEMTSNNHAKTMNDSVESIVISDDSNDSNEHTNTTATTTILSSQTSTTSSGSSSREFAGNFKMQKPRLGLSKTKSKMTRQKSTAKNSETPTSQTRLSMFGFQKRPVLKP